MNEEFFLFPRKIPITYQEGWKVINVGFVTVTDMKTIKDFAKKLNPLVKSTAWMTEVND